MVRAGPTLALGLVVAACATPPAPHAPLPTVPIDAGEPTPALAPVSAEAPQAFRPTLASDCVVGAKSGALVGLELCGASKTACFGHIVRRTSTILELRLAQGGAPEMLVVVGGPGVRVSAIVDGSQVELHQGKPQLVANWFLPGAAPARVDGIEGANATVHWEPGDVDPAAPLVATLPCAELAIDAPLIDPEAAAKALGLKRTAIVALPASPLPLRARADEPPIATLHAGPRHVGVYGRSGTKARVLVPVTGGFALGWVDASAPARELSEFALPGPVLTKLEGIARKVSCKHDVEVVVEVDRAIVQAATIAAGTGFDPNDLPEVFRRAGIELGSGARASIAASALDGCERDEGG